MNLKRNPEEQGFSRPEERDGRVWGEDFLEEIPLRWAESPPVPALFRAWGKPKVLVSGDAPDSGPTPAFPGALPGRVSVAGRGAH